MPKMKTISSAKKRFKVTASGKIKAARAFRRHLLTKKGRDKKRELRSNALYIKSCDMDNVSVLLPYC